MRCAFYPRKHFISVHSLFCIRLPPKYTNCTPRRCVLVPEGFFCSLVCVCFVWQQWCCMLWNKRSNRKWNREKKEILVRQKLLPEYIRNQFYGFGKHDQDQKMYFKLWLDLKQPFFVAWKGITDKNLFSFFFASCIRSSASFCVKIIFSVETRPQMWAHEKHFSGLGGVEFGIPIKYFWTISQSRKYKIVVDKRKFGSECDF